MRILILTLAFLMSVSVSLCPAAEGPLSFIYLDDRTPVKIYLGRFVNESGKDHIVADDFKTFLAQSIKNRRSVRFELVNSPELSEIQVSGIIKDYKYLEHGPIKPSPSIGGMLLDAAASATENYVEMAVEFTVIETKAGKVLWKETLGSYIKKLMTPQESVPLIYEKMSRTFLWKSFGNPK